ncbi:MAG: toll/interleukin-1 receptor domain-containing protein [Kineosporiaceae bacterium]|jgi:hypothetical protein
MSVHDNAMGRASIFISHISQEAQVAELVRSSVLRDFLGLFDIFASSDTASIAAGDDWLAAVERALQKASVFLVLCSPASKYRPWLQFEAGAAWMRRIPIVPLCHAGLTPADLPMPLSTRQGVALDAASGVRRLYERLAAELSCASPQVDHAQLAGEVAALGAPPSTDDLLRIETDRHVQTRLMNALAHPRYRWRSLDRLAAESAVSPELAADSLRGNPDVRFGRGRSGNVIVGLQSRVGERPDGGDRTSGPGPVA